MGMHAGSLRRTCSRANGRQIRVKGDVEETSTRKFSPTILYLAFGETARPRQVADPRPRCFRERNTILTIRKALEHVVMCRRLAPREQRILQACIAEEDGEDHLVLKPGDISQPCYGEARDDHPLPSDDAPAITRHIQSLTMPMSLSVGYAVRCPR